MARAMTSQELTYIRTDSQASLLFMAIHKPTTVYTALVNQTFSTLDEVSQITYAAGSGTLANVLPGMTMYVSATPSQGTCSGTTTVTCSLGTLTPAANA